MTSEILLAAALMHPESDTYCEKFNASEIDPSGFYQVLVSNKILLRAVRRADLTQSTAGAIVRALMARSQLLRSAHARYRKVDEELFRVVDLFESHGIDMVFIKPVSYLPIDSDNYDVLVRREDLAHAFEALKQEGFVHLTKIIEPDKYLFREVNHAKTFVAIHLHTHIGWDGVRFLDPEVAWRRHRTIRLRDRRVRVLSFDHNLLVTFAHSYFENHQFRLSDLAFACEDVLSRQVNWDYVMDAARTANWGLTFMETLERVRSAYVVLFGQELMEEQDAVRLPVGAYIAPNPKAQGDISLPQDLPLMEVFHSLMRKIWKDNIPARRRLAISFLNVKLILQRRTSGEPHNKIVVSFSGPDQSGKTTHASLLCKNLEDRGIPVQYLWTRGGPFVSDRIWSSMRGTLVGKERDRTRMGNLKQARVAASYIYLINQFLKLKAGILLSRGAEVKVLDRNLRDTAVDVESEFACIPSYWILRCLEYGLPEPKIRFLMSRSTPRRELSLPERDRYTVAMRDKKITRIDSNEDIAENSMKILSMTLREYYTA